MVGPARFGVTVPEQIAKIWFPWYSNNPESEETGRPTMCWVLGLSCVISSVKEITKPMTIKTTKLSATPPALTVLQALMQSSDALWLKDIVVARGHKGTYVDQLDMPRTRGIHRSL